MLVVPVQALPNQTLQCVLGGQSVQLSIYQQSYGLFMDVSSNGTLIIAGVICENGNRIVRDAYLGFLGDFAWYDTQSTTDPIYTGLGLQYVLLYLETTDLVGLEGEEE
jgi:hypothetical protein